MAEFDVAVIGMGALGSAAAYHSALKGASVIAFEQFDLGHVRGASHDTSRIVRTAYGSAPYVALAKSAYKDWAELEKRSGERLLDITGGLVFMPDDGPYKIDDFVQALTPLDVPFEVLDHEQVNKRWPQFTIKKGVRAIYTADTGIAHAARTVATLQMQARTLGAVIRDRCPIDSIVPSSGGKDGPITVRTAKGDEVKVKKVIVACDAWTNKLIAPLGTQIPLTVMQEQVTYFRPEKAESYTGDKFPVWIWEDEKCYYGFPAYGEPTIKAARDVSENVVKSPDHRTFVPRDDLLKELDGFMGGFIPGKGDALRTVTCQYALAPERRFIIGPLDKHPNVLVALASGHGFKFTPAIGRVLAELAVDGKSTDDISQFTVSSPKQIKAHL